MYDMVLRLGEVPQRLVGYQTGVQCHVFGGAWLSLEVIRVARHWGGDCSLVNESGEFAPLLKIAAYPPRVPTRLPGRQASIQSFTDREVQLMWEVGHRARVFCIINIPGSLPLVLLVECAPCAQVVLSSSAVLMMREMSRRTRGFEITMCHPSAVHCISRHFTPGVPSGVWPTA